MNKRKLSTRIIGAALCSAMVCATIFSTEAFAQMGNYYPDEGTRTALDETRDATTAAAIKRDNENSDGKVAGTDEQPGSAADDMRGGGVQYKVPNLNPIGGATGAMNNGDVYSMVAKTSSSKLGLYNIVTNLTEPGVAQGINATLSQSQSFWANRLTAEQFSMNANMLNPKGADVAVSRLACLSDQLGQNSDPVAATSACSGGDKPTEPAAGLAVANVAGDGISFDRYDPNHANFVDSSGIKFTDSPCLKPNEICGTDYLFNQEIRRLAALADLTPPDAIPGIKSFDPKKAIQQLQTSRQAFLDFVGDIKLTAEMKSNVLTTTSTIVPPTKGSSKTLIEMQEEARYEDINKVMRDFCEWSNLICSGGTCSTDRNTLIKAQYPTELGDNNPKDVASEVRDFWRDSGPAKEIRQRISTSLFIVKPKVFEDLYSLYKADSNYYNNNKDGVGANGPCGGFYTGDGDPANYLALYKYERGEFVGPPVPIRNPVNKEGFFKSDTAVNRSATWHNSIYRMSKLIGRASFLDFIGQQATFIQNALISSSGLTSRMRLETLNLLNTAALRGSTTGAKNIEEARALLSSRIRIFIAENIHDEARARLANSTSAYAEQLNSVAGKTDSPNAAGNN